MKLAISLCCLLMMSAEGSDEIPEANTPFGKIRGSAMTTRLGKKIYAYRGIRYAEPPIGKLRFEPPVPVNPWDETFDASEEGPMCPQPRCPTRNDSMSEDCLRLNIYTTKLPEPGSPIKRPVLVFFHPGGFYVYSGKSSLFGPQYLLDHDIVVVTVQYRLGALGFLSLGDDHAPGNLGLKDQVIALKFIKSHIAEFGGDPDSITISGDSAGAWSVICHMVSPMSQGLFHRAIAMSGSVTYQNPLPPHQRRLSKKVARLLGCPTECGHKMVDCLRTKTPEEIANTLRYLTDWHGDPILLWTPVIEPDEPGIERFLSEQPMDLIRQGKFAKVPLLTGVTADEFGTVIGGVIENAKKGNTGIIDEWNTDWNKIAPISFFYERDTPRSINISERLRQYYLKGQPVSLDNINGMSDLYADGTVIFAVHRLANMISQYSDKPVYQYKFSYQGRYSWHTGSDKKPVGVSHQDDLMYIFHIGSLFPTFDADAPEIPIVKKMTSMWANFVQTGQPIPQENEDFVGITWTPHTPENQAYMDINNTLSMQTGLYADRMNEWEKLFPLEPLPKSDDSSSIK